MTNNSFNIKILGETYKVILDDKSLTQKCEEYSFDSEHTYGVCDSRDKIIYIKASQKPRDVIHTLIHECLHAVGNISGHKMLAESTIKGELFVDMLSNSIIQLLEQNNFISFVQETLAKGGINK